MKAKLAYLAGLVAADGHLEKDGCGVSIYSNNRAFASVARKLLQEIVPTLRVRTYRSKGAWRIYVYSARLCTTLGKQFAIPMGKKSHRILFPRGLSKLESKRFVQGYVDGDGSFYMERRKRYGRVYLYPRVEVASQSKRFLQQLRAWLEDTGIACGQVHGGRRVFRLRVYAGNAAKFMLLIGFRHPNKAPLPPIPQAVDAAVQLDSTPGNSPGETAE